MLDEYFDYLQKILDASHQSPAIELNLPDALTDHPFFGLHHVILSDLLF
jgi:hypothetical protein